MHRAIDQYGQIIDVYASARRDTRAARRFLARALREQREPVEVVTDRAPASARAILDLMAAFHDTAHYGDR